MYVRDLDTLMNLGGVNSDPLRLYRVMEDAQQDVL